MVRLFQTRGGIHRRAPDSPRNCGFVCGVSSFLKLVDEIVPERDSESNLDQELPPSLPVLVFQESQIGGAISIVPES
jgi:hypothetical protein